MKKDEGVPAKYAKTAIKITTKTDTGYIWDDSNPKGFKAWMDDVVSPYSIKNWKYMKTQLKAYPVKPKGKLRFMIITTLVVRVEEENPNKSATTMDLLEMVIRSGSDVKALNEQNARFDAFEKMFIQRKENGVWEIINPVNPEENFADKWHENNDEKAKAFFMWVDWLWQDLYMPTKGRDSVKAFKALSEGLGRDFMKGIYNDLSLPVTATTINVVSKKDTEDMPIQLYS